MEEPLLLNWYDVVLLVIICIGAIRGWMMGLSAQLSRLAGLLFIVILILSLRGWGMGLVQTYTSLPNSVIPPLVILALLAAGLAATALIRLVLGAIVHVQFAPWAERLGGFTGGVLQTGFALFAITLIIQIIPFSPIKTHTRKQSVLGNLCHKTASSGWRALLLSHPEVQDWADQWPVPVDAIFQGDDEDQAPDNNQGNGKTTEQNPSPENTSPESPKERTFLGEIEDVLPLEPEPDASFPDR